MHWMTEDGHSRFSLIIPGLFSDRIDQLLVRALKLLRRHRSSLLRLSVLYTTAASLAGCAGPLSALDPVGQGAHVISTLWWAMLVGSIAIFSLVVTLLILAWRSQGVAASATSAGNERIWIMGLGIAFPTAVLIVLLGYSLWIGEQLLPRQSPVLVKVQAEARQWAWTFSYDDAPGRKTENVLHIPAGRPVDIAVTTRDVIHSFWVPRLAGKLDAIPGHVNVLRVETDVPGVYAGRSSEFSGAGYDDHSFTVVVHESEDWQTFLRGQE